MSTTTEKLTCDRDGIPDELKGDQCVLWKTVKRNGKATKIPYQVDGQEAKSNDPKTWSSFDAVWQRYQKGGYDGVGWMFSYYDPYAGIDLDGCRDPETGDIDDWAMERIKTLNTYTEVSPSGTGVKCYVKGKSPFDTGKKKDLDYPSRGGKNSGIEIYDNRRYFALTGWRLDDFPETPQARDLQWLREEFWPEPKRVNRSTPRATDESQNDVVARARRYVDKMPEAISGSGGHNATFAVACALILGFDLDEDTSLDVLREYNDRCEPPWTGHELQHKIESASQLTGERGYLRDAPRDGKRKNKTRKPKVDTDEKRLITMGRRFVKSRGAGVSGDGRGGEALTIVRHLVSLVTENSGLRLNEQQIMELIKPWNDTNVPPFTEDELGRVIQMVKTKPPADRVVAAVIRGGNTNKKAGFGSMFPLTDSGNAERLVALHGDKVRYCHPMGKWFAWDTQRWAIDQTGMVEQLAKKTARSILEDAARVKDDDDRDELIKWSRRSESVGARTAMLKLAQSEPGIPVMPDDLDKNIWKINLENGTFDLQTGKLLPYDKRDLITKLAPVHYDPDAKMPQTQKFLEEILNRDQELITFNQRFFGYCLTGDVGEQILPISYGPGANGKSTLLNNVFDVMGPDYSMKAGADMLLTKHGQEHPTALTDLHGKRLVVCIETDDGRRLAESLVKELTGGDRIRARRMREDFWEFSPTHKIILACNHKPTIRGTDHAIWRRIRLIPFDVVIPPESRDKQLPSKLKSERVGFFAWLVRGCLDWQQHGLGEPKAITVATSEYASDEDTLAQFITTCCVQGDTAVKASQFVDAYREWSGEKRMTVRRMTKLLADRGVEKYTNNGVWYRNIGLQATEQRNV